MVNQPTLQPPARVTIRSQMMRYAPSVSRSLQLLAVVVFVGLIGVTYQQLAQLRDTTLEDTHRQMTRLDMVLAEQTGRAMETIDFILRGLSEGAPGAMDTPAAATNTLRRRINGVRQLLAVDMVTPDGKIAASSRPAIGETLPAIGLALVARLVADPKAGLLFSEPIRQADSTWTVLVTRRIENRDQGFEGVGVAWLNLFYFEEFYKAVELTENGAIILHRRDGIVLARYPHEEKLIGASFAELPPFKDILSKSIAGSVEMDGQVDGSRRILAIRALKAFPLAVNVSVDKERVLAGWRRETTTLTVAATVLGLMLALLLFQLARRSREVEALLNHSGEARDAAIALNTRLVEQMAERERAEAALRQAQRVEAVGQLTGGVAHDFNNLLTIVLGNIELIQSQPASGPFAARLSTMQAAAERGATLTAQLLAFARRQPLMPRSVDLGQTITDMRALLQSAVGSQIGLVLDLNTQAPHAPALYARVDPTQIELVLLNLAINARDAMPLGGTLTIATRKVVLTETKRPDTPAPGTYVAIRVTDTGAGMSPEILARAFEPFFTTKGPAAGSGLGLSQVYGLARQSDGMAQIESQPGGGTTVEVLLPQSTEPVPATPHAPGPAAPHQGRAQVLVVDDDADVRTTTAMLLRHLGYGVTEAATAEDALDTLHHMPQIELLLSDVVMPQTSGPELARRVRLSRPELPIVFFSGYADPEAIAGAGPVIRLLRKPFRPNELAKIIESALADAKHPDLV